MKITKEILAELEDDFKTAEIYRPTYSDLITDIFMAYSHLERIYNRLKHIYEREARYHECKQKLELAQDNIIQNSEKNPLRSMKIQSND